MRGLAPRRERRHDDRPGLLGPKKGGGLDPPDGAGWLGGRRSGPGSSELTSVPT